MVKRVGLALMLVAALGCAGTTPKAVLVASDQAYLTGLVATDDAERVACFGTTALPAVPAARSHCTAGTPGLTDAVHLKVTQELIQAYASIGRLGPAIKAWKVGMAVPTDLATSLDFAQQVKDTVAALGTSTAQQGLSTAAQQWLDALKKLQTAFQPTGGVK